MSDVVTLLGQGFAIALDPLNLLLIFGGVLIGTTVGMLPGIGPINAIAILIPLTFAAGLRPESALIMFAGIYYGAQFGNSISAILLNVPGTAGAVATIIDGHPMAQSGRAGPALAMSAIASFTGGTISVVGLMLFAPVLSRAALHFGPAEYFVLMVFALSMIASLSAGYLLKGIISAIIGLMVTTIGLDPGGTIPRYTFGQLKLYDGIDFVVIIIGLFAVSEVFLSIERAVGEKVAPSAVGRVMITGKEFFSSVWTTVRSAILGFFVGVLPGAGASMASFLAYTTERQIHGAGGTFGRGDIRGVAAAESANNAATSGAFIPLLTLGVPGSASTAVMLAALIGFNVVPGPLLIQNRPEVFWGLVASMYVGNVMLLVLNLPLVGVFVRILQVPRTILMPFVLILSFASVYAVNNSPFDLVLMTAIGVVGYLMRKLEFPLAPAILALVLGQMMEVNLRTALALSDGVWLTFVSGPITLVLWALTIASLFSPLLLRAFGKMRSAMRRNNA